MTQQIYEKHDADLLFFVRFVFQVVHVFLFFYFILKKKKKTFCILDTKHQVTNLAE